MNLPISWVIAGAIPVSQVVKQSASLAATSASHFFGGLMQTNLSQTNPQPADNGRSVQVEPDQNQKPSSGQRSWLSRVESLRTYLSNVVTKARVSYGLPPDPTLQNSISISANGKDQPVLNGPEPLRTEIENHLHQHPALVEEINELATQRECDGPLGLLPKLNVPSNAGEPWKLWIDV